MTTVENHPSTHTTSSRPDESDIYDPDDVGLRDSPMLKPMKVRFEPSPSPEPTDTLPDSSSESSPDPEDRKSKKRPKKYQKSPGDAVLIAFMGNGNQPDVARDAGEKPLASESEEMEEPVKGTRVDITVTETQEEPEEVADAVEIPAEKDLDNDPMELAALAAGAVGMLAENAQASQDQAQCDSTSKTDVIKVEISAPEDPMEDVKPTPSIHPLKALHVDSSIAQSSLKSKVKHEMIASPTAEELPPILLHSPQSALSNGSNPNQITLPSIHESIGDINHLPEPSPAGESPYAQSPPGRPPPRGFVLPGHSPKSPNDTFRRELPSPAYSSSFHYNGLHRRTSQTDQHQYTSAADYSSSNTETPSTDQSGSTPAAIGIDRMSIDGITHPQVGGFHCIYPGCNAQPFQTQVRDSSLALTLVHF